MLQVSDCVGLYGASILSGAFKMKKYNRILLPRQRRCALKVVSAYRTMSEEPGLTVAEVVPYDLLASGKKRLSGW